MYLVEKVSAAISSSISSSLKLDEDNEKIIAYGAFTLIQTFLCILLVVIFGSIFKVLIGALIVSFTGSFLRKYSGGAHATSPGRCAIIGTFIAVGLAIVSRGITKYNNILMIILLGLMCFVYSYYFILKLSPVDSPSKPITKIEKKLHLRKMSVILLHCLAAICILLILFYYKNSSIKSFNITICIYEGIAWQSFTLTAKGHKILHYIDKLLKNIIVIKGDGVK